MKINRCMSKFYKLNLQHNYSILLKIKNWGGKIYFRYKNYYMEIFKNRTFEPPKLKFIYVSTNEQYCSFEKYKEHQNQCILMPMNKKILNNLLKYSDGRSQAIIDFVALQEMANSKEDE